MEGIPRSAIVTVKGCKQFFVPVSFAATDACCVSFIFFHLLSFLHECPVFGPN